VAIKELIVAP